MGGAASRKRERARRGEHRYGRDSRLDRRAERVGYIGTGRGRVSEALGAALRACAAPHVVGSRVELVDVVERGP